MPNPHKSALISTLKSLFGAITKLAGSESLYSIANDTARIYVRYSKLHPRGRTFFGLRQVDLRQLDGQNAFVCFLFDDNSEPLFVRYADFEDVFASAEPASDGQYKVQLHMRANSLEMYIPKCGRFNVDGCIGYDVLKRSIVAASLPDTGSLTHSQVQTLVGGIGVLKGFQVWIPSSDIGTLDWSLTTQFRILRALPTEYSSIESVLSEIDVVWIQPGSNRIDSLFEVEHTTPVYTGLLRFNDVLLTDRRVERFTVIANDNRRSIFVRQLRRPTFQSSGLSDVASFMEYQNVFEWHRRLRKEAGHA